MRKLPGNKTYTKVATNLHEAINEEFHLGNIGEYLNDIGSQIKQITGNSEEQFLEIGSKLQLFLSKSRQLSTESSEAASSISGAILKNGITEVNWLLKQFSDSLTASAGEIKKDKEELLRISADVLLIMEGLDGFRKIVKHLRMLGISTKIESARLGDDDKGFNTLADHVEKLSHMINEKSTAISAKSTSLLTEINRTTKELERLETDQKNQSDMIVNNSVMTLNQLEGKYNECSVRVDKISQSSQNVSKNIGGVVTSIQFHDITRQQMEHVHEALDEITLQINWSEVQDTNTPDIDEKLGAVYDVCELQSIQLNSAMNEFVEAVENIIRMLKDVEENVTEIFSDTLCLLTEDNSSNKDSLSNVKDELSAILIGLKKNEEISDKLAISIKSVIEIVEDLSKYVLQIEEIGTEIEIIALNARIKAAHTGLNGLALGVLAEAIQNLSIDAKAQTIELTKILQNIGEISKTLQVSIDNSAEEKEKQNNSEMHSKIFGLINTIYELEKETKVKIEKIRGDVTDLKDEINVSVEEIQIHHQNKQIANEAIDHLNRIMAEMKSRVNINSDKRTNVMNLKAKYTMDSERKIHEAFSDNNKLQMETSTSEAAEEGDYFGDNVDLFLERK